ncbi:MAG TPA: hypothetical protein VGG72_13415 [Bryobacteraceae bacterium]|jgi:hypothetical protein
MPRLLMRGQVILLAVLLLGDPVGVRGDIMKLSGALVVFVVRAVVVSCGH